MCGIAGIVSTNGKLAAEILPSMCDVVFHRGPDDEGLFTSTTGLAALGHRRLSILDLSSRGRQPMATPDGRYAISFNGEVYNYVELRAELQSRGVVFTTGTDTEVVLRAYETWGVNALERLAGMFAFAIWDEGDRRLFIARDRIGKKPLLYYWDGSRFAFCSELKQLLAIPRFRPELDPAAVELYLSFGYIPAPASIFKQVRKLPAAHYLELSGGRLDIRRYWFPERSKTIPAADRRQRLEELKSLLSDAVRIRLRSDVPIAMFLSGGVDSAAIAAECGAQGHDIQAFTTTFDHDQTDLPFAELVAKHLGLRHEVVRTTGDAIGDEIHKIIWHYDEPFADTSSIPSYYIARACQGRFRVVLNGDGGDEAFGGYRHYEHVREKQLIKNVAIALGLKDGRVNRPWHVYFQSKSLFRRAERAALLGDRLQADCAVSEFLDSEVFLRAYCSPNALKRALWADRHVYLPNDLLFKMDIALMASHIEGRSPFLDHRLLEWAQELPTRDIVSGSQKKVLLREALRHRLPHEVLDRPKHGFGAPIASWLRNSLADISHAFLPTPLFERRPQLQVLDVFRQSDGRSAGRVWTLLMFALWAKQWNVSW